MALAVEPVDHSKFVNPAGAVKVTGQTLLSLIFCPQFILLEYLFNKYVSIAILSWLDKAKL